MRKLAPFLLLCAVSALAQNPPPQAAAAGYSQLVFNPNFSSLNLCTGNTPGCDFYNPGGVGSCSQGTVTTPSNYLNLNWVSGQGNCDTVVTSYSANGLYGHGWLYGYFEVSMLFDPDTGHWPALWFQGVSTIGTSPYTGPELDIFEWQSLISNTSAPNQFNGTLHVWSAGVDTASRGVTPQVSAITWSNYNTYGVLWTPTEVCWYLNNVLMGSCQSTTGSPYNTVFAGQYNLFLIFDTGPGCNFTYPCSGQNTPLNMQIQSVRVFQAPSASISSGALSSGFQSKSFSQ